MTRPNAANALAGYGIVFALAARSLLNRRLTAGLTVLSIAVSVALLVGVDRIRSEAKASFVNTVSGADLIVGARSGPVNLLLYSVFRIGDATSNISWNSYQTIASRPEVAWSIPLSLGDAHRGFRVLGTTGDYFAHYRYGRGQPLEFASGQEFADIADAVIGADVARALDYTVGDSIIVSHGIGDVSFEHHDDMPFRVSGILRRTGTPVDRTVHVTLAAIEAIHDDDEHGHDEHEADHGESPADDDHGHDEHEADDDHDHGESPADDDHGHDDHGHDDHEADDEHDHGESPADDDHGHDDHGHDDHEADDEHDHGESPADDDHGHDEHEADDDHGHNEHHDDDAHGHDEHEADDENGHDQADDHAHGHDESHAAEESLTPDEITAAIFGLQSRPLLFSVQRFVNEYDAEPLTAIVPGVAMQQLWELVGVAETALLALSAFVVAACLIGMLTTLLTSLAERRREMAVLRSLGAGPGLVFGLLVAEATLLAGVAAAVGVALVHGGMWAVRGYVLDRFGLHLAAGAPDVFDVAVIALVTLAGAVIAVLPAWRAYRFSLVDGLTVRT